MRTVITLLSCASVFAFDGAPRIAPDTHGVALASRRAAVVVLIPRERLRLGGLRDAPTGLSGPLALRRVERLPFQRPLGLLNGHDHVGAQLTAVQNLNAMMNKI